MGTPTMQPGIYTHRHIRLLLHQAPCLTSAAHLPAIPPTQRPTLSRLRAENQHFLHLRLLEVIYLFWQTHLPFECYIFISSSDFFTACQVNMEDIAKRTAEAQTDWGLTGAVRTASFPWHSSGWYVWFCRYDCTNVPCCLLHFSWHFILQTLVAILVRKLRPSARCEPYLWGLSGGRSGRSRGQTC